MMDNKKIAIVTDSTSDISDAVVRKYNIKLIPLRICFSNKTYRDRFEITPDEFFEKLEREIPKSSLPAGKDVLSVLDEVKSEGYTDVLYIGISSGLSGTYNFVKIIGQEYEGLNFHCFDTKTLSMGQGGLVVEAARELENSSDIPAVINKLKKIRDAMKAFFIVEDLTYLSKGGRIGKVAGTVGSLLHINPVVYVNDDGVYETAAKALGFSRALDLLAKEIQKHFAGKKIVVHIVVGKDREKASIVLRKIQQFAEVAESSVSTVTPVLGVHTGPGLVGVIAYPVE